MIVLSALCVNYYVGGAGTGSYTWCMVCFQGCGTLPQDQSAPLYAWWVGRCLDILSYNTEKDLEHTGMGYITKTQVLGSYSASNLMIFYVSFKCQLGMFSFYNHTTNLLGLGFAQSHQV